MTELIFVRHGQTDWNYQKRYCGVTDRPLNKTGIGQVKRLRKQADLSGVAAVFTSTLKRARQTARILFPGKKASPVFSLAELDFGDWEGLTYAQVLAGYPQLYRQWLDNPYQCIPPQGESLLQLRARVMSFLKEVLKTHRDKRIVCVSHGGTIRVVICELLGRGQRDFWVEAVESASLTSFVFQGVRLLSFKLNRQP